MLSKPREPVKKKKSKKLAVEYWITAQKEEMKRVLNYLFIYRNMFASEVPFPSSVLRMVMLVADTCGNKYPVSIVRAYLETIQLLFLFLLLVVWLLLLLLNFGVWLNNVMLIKVFQIHVD